MWMSIIEAKAGDPWPPEGHRERIEAYATYRQLFVGKHQDVFQRVQQWLDKTPDKSLVYIVANFPKLVSLVCADMLFGEEPGFVAGDEGSTEQAALDNVTRANNLHALNYEMALGASMRGDAIYKLRYGQRYSYSEQSEAIISAVNPSLFFPEFAPDDVRTLVGAVIAWERKLDDRTYLRREVHTPGKIRNELWLLERGTLRRQVPLSTLPEYAGLPEEEETGYPGLLVEYVPNWRLDDDWRGISDYIDIHTLVDELNNRLSRVSRVLDKHESPKLVLPPGMMKFDPATKRYYIERDSLDVVEAPQEIGGNLPRYLVWDAQLEAAFKQIDKLIQLAFLVTETSPDAFGMGEAGQAESGRALKFRLLRTLAKVNRKRLYFDSALRNVLKATLWLEADRGRSLSDIAEVRIEWRDGLPDDPFEETQTEAMGVEAGVSSRRSAVRRLHRLTGKELEDELAEIDTDRAMAGPPDTRTPARIDLGNLFGRGEEEATGGAGEV